MPELPEVETTRRGLAPHLVGRSISTVTIREPRLRWRIRPELQAQVTGRRIAALRRRGKYLLIDLEDGTLLVHLGMSGSLCYLPEPRDPRPHDHVDFAFAGGGELRFHDPRRFGSLHHSTTPERHPLIVGMGPEPLDDTFDGAYLAGACRGRRVAIKHLVMNGAVVAGVGNIYASEALFRAGIHPLRPSGRIARERLDRLAQAVKDVLNDAIEQGGTTLRDFVGGNGEPGYFKLSLDVYGRECAPCRRCAAPIRKRTQGQRASYYCPRCQR